MNGLPEFGQYQQSDTKLSPESQVERKKTLGIYKEDDKKKSMNDSALLAQKQNSLPGLGLGSVNSKTGSIVKSGTISSNNNLLFQATLDQHKEKNLMEEKKKQLSAILTDEDLKSISIFKSKEIYFQNKSEIFSTQKKLLLLNMLFMIGLGIIIFFIAVINTIAA